MKRDYYAFLACLLKSPRAHEYFVDGTIRTNRRIRDAFRSAARNAFGKQRPRQLIRNNEPSKGGSKFSPASRSRGVTHSFMNDTNDAPGLEPKIQI
jgi:hypothetical protein